MSARACRAALRRVDRVAVVLADEQHGSCFSAAKFRLSCEDALFGRAVAEEADDDRVRPAQLQRVGVADRVGDGGADDGGRAHHAGSVSIRCIDPPLPRAQPVDLAVQLGDHRAQVAALGEVERVAAVGAEHDVVGAQRVADADRHRLLPDGQVDRALDLVGGVDAGDLFLDPADAVQRSRTVAASVPASSAPCLQQPVAPLAAVAGEVRRTSRTSARAPRAVGRRPPAESAAATGVERLRGAPSGFERRRRAGRGSRPRRRSAGHVGDRHRSAPPPRLISAAQRRRSCRHRANRQAPARGRRVDELAARLAASPDDDSSRRPLRFASWARRSSAGMTCPAGGRSRRAGPKAFAGISGDEAAAVLRGGRRRRAASRRASRSRTPRSSARAGRSPSASTAQRLRRSRAGSARAAEVDAASSTPLRGRAASPTCRDQQVVAASSRPARHGSAPMPPDQPAAQEDDVRPLGREEALDVAASVGQVVGPRRDVGDAPVPRCATARAAAPTRPCASARRPRRLSRVTAVASRDLERAWPRPARSDAS